MMRCGYKCVALCLLLLAWAGPLYSQSPREQLRQLVQQLQTSPNDNVLRERIINLASEIKPPPALPEEAERRMVRGGVAFKNAMSPADYKVAVAEFEEATRVAPWYGDAYFNLGMAQNKAEGYDAALRSLRFAQIAAPDSREIKALVYEVEFLKEKAGTPAARAAETRQRDEELVRSLNGVRFDCPNFSFTEGMLEERWIVISGNELVHWSKVLRTAPERARVDTVGQTSRLSRALITGAVAFPPELYMKGRTFSVSADNVVLREGSEILATCSRSR